MAEILAGDIMSCAERVALALACKGRKAGGDGGAASVKSRTRHTSAIASNRPIAKDRASLKISSPMFDARDAR